MDCTRREREIKCLRWEAGLEKNVNLERWSGGRGRRKYKYREKSGQRERESEDKKGYDRRCESTRGQEEGRESTVSIHYPYYLWLHINLALSLFSCSLLSNQRLLQFFEGTNWQFTVEHYENKKKLS